MPKRAAPAVMPFGEVLEQAKCRRNRRREWLEEVEDGEGRMRDRASSHCV